MYMKKCRRAPCAVGVGRSVGWVSLTAHAALGGQTEYASLAADAHADKGMRVVMARRLSDCRRGWFAWSLGPHLTAATFLAHPRRRPLLISLSGPLCEISSHKAHNRTREASRSKPRREPLMWRAMDPPFGLR